MQIKKTFYISLAFILFLLISIAFFDYYVLNKKIIMVSNDILSMRKQSETLRSRLAYSAFMEKEGRRMIKERQRLETFHSFHDTLEFINFLEESAKISGNQIKVTIREGKKQLFTVQLTGSFNSLITFLIRLENISAEIDLAHIIREENDTLAPNEIKPIKTELIITPSQALPSIL